MKNEKTKLFISTYFRSWSFTAASVRDQLHCFSEGRWRECVCFNRNHTPTCCTSTRTHIRAHTHTHARTHTHTHARTHTHTRARTHTHALAHTRTRAHTHTHTHTALKYLDFSMTLKPVALAWLVLVVIVVASRAPAEELLCAHNVK